MIRLLNRLDAKHPVMTKIAALLIAFVCLYFGRDADQKNDTALRLQILSTQRSST